MPGKGLLERLAEGPVIGDGGFVFALEKRGYVKAGPWTPEANVEHPEAGGNHACICKFRDLGRFTQPLREKYAPESSQLHMNPMNS